MASFQAKTGWRRLKKRENKNYRFVSFRTEALEKIQEKQQKRGRKRENKNCLSVPLLHDGKYRIPKKEKKSKKIKKYHCGFVSRQNRLENAEKEKNKNCLSVPFRSDW